MSSDVKIKDGFKDLIPALSDEEFKQLENNIITDGCRDPLVVWRNGSDWLIDGHNRLEICTKHNIPFNTTIKEFPSEANVKEWIILNQFGRRNLSAYNKSILALKLKDMIASRAKENQVEAGKNKLPQKSVKAVDTQKELAKIAGVSHDTIAKVEKIEKIASDEQKKKLYTGEMSINQAYKEVRKEAKKEDRKQRALAAENIVLTLDSIDIRFGDFRETLADIPDSSVDLILTHMSEKYFQARINTNMKC